MLRETDIHISMHNNVIYRPWEKKMLSRPPHLLEGPFGTAMKLERSNFMRPTFCCLKNLHRICYVTGHIQLRSVLIGHKYCRWMSYIPPVWFVTRCESIVYRRDFRIHTLHSYPLSAKTFGNKQRSFLIYVFHPCSARSWLHAHVYAVVISATITTTL